MNSYRSLTQMHHSIAAHSILPTALCNMNSGVKAPRLSAAHLLSNSSTQTPAPVAISALGTNDTSVLVLPSVLLSPLLALPITCAFAFVLQTFHHLVSLPSATSPASALLVNGGVVYAYTGTELADCTKQRRTRCTDRKRGITTLYICAARPPKRR